MCVNKVEYLSVWTFKLLFFVALQDLFKVFIEIKLLLHEGGVVHGAQFATELSCNMPLVKVLRVQFLEGLVSLLVHEGAVVDRIAKEWFPHTVEVLEYPRPADDVVLVKENRNSTLKETRNKNHCSPNLFTEKSVWNAFVQMLWLVDASILH